MSVSVTSTQVMMKGSPDQLMSRSSKMSDGVEPAAAFGQLPEEVLRALVGLNADSELLRDRLALEKLIQRPDGAVFHADPATLQRRLLRLGELTRTELISIHAGEAPRAELLQQAFPDDAALVARGVKLKIVFPAAHSQLLYLRDYTDHMSQIGANIRFADALPHRLIVSDRCRAMVPRDYQDLSQGALEVTNPVLTRALAHLSVSLYRRGSSLAEIPLGSKPIGPTEWDLKMLEALSRGVTDEVAARTLAISERTFRRYLNILLQKLGASNRFQAGVRAVERGWL